MGTPRCCLSDGNGHLLSSLATKGISYPLWTCKHSYKYYKIESYFTYVLVFRAASVELQKNYEIRNGFIFFKMENPTVLKPFQRVNAKEVFRRSEVKLK